MHHSSTRLSAPDIPRQLPRELTQPERRALAATADVLVGRHEALQRPSESPRFQAAVDRALLARIDSFEIVIAHASALAASSHGLEPALRALAEEDPDSFHVLSSVLAGAYLTIPEVRSEIGYPGQERRFARFDEAAEQLMNGILDPVIERGPVFREP